MNINCFIQKIRKRYLKKYPFCEIDVCKKGIELFDEEANQFLKNKIDSGNPLMVAKFGTIELATMRNYQAMHRFNTPYHLFKYIQGKGFLCWWEMLDWINVNAGVFPKSVHIVERFCKLMFTDTLQIDILGSYLYGEKDVEKYYPKARKINLDGYCAPFLWKEPWTQALKGKKVLVIHPFEDTIIKQYKKRELVFTPALLPEFELKTIRAVQSVANEPTEYADWFEALNSMKSKIDEIDFDIALIGCGAYGMPLAAHVKRKGKQAIHMGAWVQFIFGIAGKRWDRDNTEFKHLINEHWIRPSADETPQNANKVEVGCYW